MQNRADPQANAFTFGSANPFAFFFNALWVPMPGVSALSSPVADVTAKLEPVTRAATRAQFETMALMGKQGRTAFDASSRLMACRTPQDLASVQLQFWQTAAQQQAEGVQRIMAAWGSLAVGAVPPAPKASAQPVKRDILAFREPAATAAAPVAAKDVPTTPRFAAE